MWIDEPEERGLNDFSGDFFGRRAITTDKVRDWFASVSGGRERELSMIQFLAMNQGFRWSMLGPVIPLFARDLGASEMELGSIAIVPALATILFSIPGNALGVKYGKRSLFIWSQATGMVCGVLLLVTKTIDFLILPQLVFGISNLLFWPTELAYMTEVIVPEMRARVVGYCMAISSLGSVLGPVVGGYLTDHMGFRWVFAVFAAMSVIGWAVARKFPVVPTSKRGSVLATVKAALSGVRMILKRPMLQVTTLNSFLQFLNVGTTEFFLPVFLKEAGYSATFIGTTTTLRTLGMTTVRLFIGELVGKMSAVRLLFGGLVVCALCAGLTPIIPTSQFILLGCFVMGVAFGLSPVLTSTVIAEHTTAEERALGMALDSTSGNSGRVTSGFLLGAMAKAVGFGGAITLGNCIVLSGFLVILRLYRRARYSSSTG